MSGAWSGMTGQVLAEHEIYLFFEFDLVAQAQRAHGPRTNPHVDDVRRAADMPASHALLVLRGLADVSASGLPADQIEALTQRYGHEHIWERAVGETGTDFYPHVRELATGRDAARGTFWKLGERALRVVNSADLYGENVAPAQRVRKHMVLNLKTRATERLREHGVDGRPLLISLDAVTLHVFPATAKRIVSVRVVAAPGTGGRTLAPLELLELQFALAHANKLDWIAHDGTATDTRPFSLDQLVRCLVGAMTPADTRRVRSYTYARFETPIAHADADRFGLYLARHYSTDYKVAAELAGVERVRTFETVGHTVSLEGSATIVAPTPGTGPLPSFLLNYRTNTLRQHYVPIALLATHELGFLVDRTRRSVMPYHSDDESGQILSNLAALRLEALIFRGCFRFTQVSHISLHNELNLAFRRALGLDRMLAEFTADVNDIDAYLRAQSELRKEEQGRWRTAVGFAAFGGLTAFTIMREVLSATVHGYEAFVKSGGILRDLRSTLSAWRDAFPEATSIDLIAVLVGLAIGWWVFHWHLKRTATEGHAHRSEQGDEFAERAKDSVLDQTIHSGER